MDDTVQIHTDNIPFTNTFNQNDMMSHKVPSSLSARSVTGQCQGVVIGSTR
ncbi:11944_t:CDS:2 [Funneliformis caledonium]|uniref:11944_t:CDS:1 n=1 Tax=Funneliformis caledonium TaxID=1117310 RepID=A0A9N8ZAU9_9GLOM|nr:11944_t:CDS:2 [Funneliformis caledonium]